MFWVYVIGTVSIVLVWEAWTKDHPQELGEWNSHRIFGAWLVFMLWPFTILYLIVAGLWKKFR